MLRLCLLHQSAMPSISEVLHIRRPAAVAAAVDTPDQAVALHGPVVGNLEVVGHIHPAVVDHIRPVVAVDRIDLVEGRPEVRNHHVADRIRPAAGRIGLVVGLRTAAGRVVDRRSRLRSTRPACRMRSRWRRARV